jgi:amidase
MPMTRTRHERERISPGYVQAAAGGLDLDTATIPYLQQQITNGHLSATGLTRAYLDRIRRMDGGLNAVIMVNPEAESQARESDSRHQRGAALSLLDGIPVLLKDTIDTVWSDTTAGSRALLGSTPLRDAVIVQRLRAAGAVMLGKANMSEWANFRSINATSGWSAVRGQTNNPHVLDRNPCGSSSGCAVAVAASLTQVAIGVETDGSLLCPAGTNGVVGHKPSVGLVPRTGIVPVSLEQDTAGPMTRHVVDTAVTLAALCGHDDSDPATSAVPGGQPGDYAGLLRPHALAGRRVGVWRLPGRDADVDRIVGEAVTAVRALGATVVDVDLPYQDELGSFPVLVVEFRRDLEKYLASRPGAPGSITELIAFNRSDPVELSLFGQEILEQAAAAPSADDPEYQASRQASTDLARRSIDEVMTGHQLDVIMAPTNGPAWKTDYANIDAFVVGSSSPAAIAGYPSLSVPAGFAGPLPVGISWFAGRWADAAVLSFGYAFEQATKARRPPRYQRTLTWAQRRRRRRNSTADAPC